MSRPWLFAEQIDECFFWGRLKTGVSLSALLTLTPASFSARPIKSQDLGRRTQWDRRACQGKRIVQFRKVTMYARQGSAWFSVRDTLVGEQTRARQAYLKGLEVCGFVSYTEASCLPGGRSAGISIPGLKHLAFQHRGATWTPGGSDWSSSCPRGQEPGALSWEHRGYCSVNVL